MMKEFTESPTKEMKIDILSCQDSPNIVLCLPELKAYRFITAYMDDAIKELPAGETITYIVLLYSVDSIINGHPMPDLKERQGRAAQLAGFKKTSKGNFSRAVTDILFPLADERLVNMAFEFLIRQNNLEWEELMATERLRYNYLRSMMDNANMDDPSKMKMKNNLRAAAGLMTSELKRRYDDFFDKEESLIAKAREVAHNDFIEDRAS